MRAKRRGIAGHSWYLDETYIKVSGKWRYLYRAIDREGNLLDSMLIEHRNKHADRRSLRRLIDSGGRKPLRMTTDKHPAYTKAVRSIVGRKVFHRQNQYLAIELSKIIDRSSKGITPMLGFAKFESASRFCSALDELRNYLRIRSVDGEHVSAFSRREIFIEKWSTLMT